MSCVTAATQNGFSRAELTLLLPRIGTFSSLHGMWLFAYESVAQGFNPSSSTTFIEEDQYFSLLLQRESVFWRSTAASSQLNPHFAAYAARTPVKSA
jgi:hypothetical protein